MKQKRSKRKKKQNTVPSGRARTCLTNGCQGLSELPGCQRGCKSGVNRGGNEEEGAGLRWRGNTSEAAAQGHKYGLISRCQLRLLTSLVSLFIGTATRGRWTYSGCKLHWKQATSAHICYCLLRGKHSRKPKIDSRLSPGDFLMNCLIAQQISTARARKSPEMRGSLCDASYQGRVRYCRSLPFQVGSLKSSCCRSGSLEFFSISSFPSNLWNSLLLFQKVEQYNVFNHLGSEKF